MQVKSALPLAAALAIILVTGVQYGLWTDRWGISGELQDKAARLSQISRTLDEWEGQDLPPLSPKEVELAGLAGHLHRSYLNRRTGHRVSVLLVCGPSGPVSVHPPDVCYQGVGYRLSEAPTRHVLPEIKPTAQFWVGDFVKPSPTTPSHLRIFWAWSVDGVWQAPDEPRQAFGRRAALFKLYVIRTTARAQEPLAEDPAQDFFKLFLPELQKRLFTS